MSVQFEWNRQKADLNELKHGVTFREAVTVFADPAGLDDYDVHHSDQEDRWHRLGSSDHRRVLVVCYTEPGDDVVRIISAREATGDEKRHYVQRTAW
jgi:uncharacterized DUF497 family protein